MVGGIFGEIKQEPCYKIIVCLATESEFVDNGKCWSVFKQGKVW